MAKTAKDPAIRMAEALERIAKAMEAHNEMLIAEAIKGRRA